MFPLRALCLRLTVTMVMVNGDGDGDGDGGTVEVAWELIKAGATIEGSH